MWLHKYDTTNKQAFEEQSSYILVIIFLVLKIIIKSTRFYAYLSS